MKARAAERTETTTTAMTRGTFHPGSQPSPSGSHTSMRHCMEQGGMECMQASNTGRPKLAPESLCRSRRQMQFISILNLPECI